MARTPNHYQRELGKLSISLIGVLVAPSAVMILALAAQSTWRPNWSMSCLVIMLPADPLSRIRKMAARDSLLEMVASEMVLVVGVDRQFVAAVDILLVAAADESEIDILAVDRLVAALWAGNYFDIGLNSDLNNDSEFGTDNWSFDIDFPIIGYLSTGDSQFGYVLVYHNSGRYVFPVATVDWLMKMDVVDFGHD
ncbi:hypothetical protein G9A89_015542 [Geosiphon pyriformis]|nr:hypothetical protein G9A89_015542 [Geosiphon pyriformis]